MSTDKLPLTEPAPHYNPGAYQVQPIDGQHVVIPPPEALKEAESSSRRNRYNEESGEQKLEDGDDMVLGIGPGWIPDKSFNLDFDHCFTEHKSTKTFSQLYKVVGIVYKYTKLTIYHIFVILIGIPMAILWAIINGITVFVVVWLWGPTLKLTILWVYAVAPAATAPLQAILGPLADVIARIFRQIRVRAHIDGSLMKKFGPEHIA